MSKDTLREMFEFAVADELAPPAVESILAGPPPSAEQVRQAADDAYGSWTWKRSL